MGQPLRNPESENRVDAALAYATEVLGDEQAALRWLDTPLWELHNLSPREVLAPARAPGLERVRDAMLRTEYRD
jgi:uncharacterized protein (DUF2384 family)